MLAGSTGVPWRRAALAGALGNLLPALAYAVAGALAVTAVDTAVVLGGVVLLGLLAWLVTGRVLARSPRP
jgi:uncharacterized membrane protein YdjX (TVP38/TMEM64 family)